MELTRHNHPREFPMLDALLGKNKQSTEDFLCKTAWLLAKQRVKSVTEDEGTCAYRGENGACCGVGLHIPDEPYRSEMEHSTFYTVMSDYPEVQDLFAELLPQLNPKQHNSLLTWIQRYHDGMEVDRHGLPDNCSYEVRLKEYEGRTDQVLAEAIAVDLLLIYGLVMGVEK